MQDIPFFHTENGVASLRLKEIPFFKTAYITLQSASDEEKFLQECVDFCRAVGAERIFATVGKGDKIDVLKMTRDADMPNDDGVMLFPVQEETMPRWRELYNQKMRNVTGAAYLTQSMANAILAERKGYFVHKDGQLLGIGTADGGEISAVASLQKGAGENVVRGLMGGLSEKTAVIEVASDNTKAMALYTALGFMPISVTATWYKIL